MTQKKRPPATGPLTAEQAATAPLKKEWVDWWRWVVVRMELNPCARSPGGIPRDPPGRTPSIAVRAAWNLLLAGVNATKCRPAAAVELQPSPVGSADQAKGLSMVLKSSRMGTAVPAGRSRP